MSSFSSWIAGAPVTTDGAPHQVINPANGNVIAEMALATPADVDVAVASARAAFRDWSTATPLDRSTVLARLAELVASMPTGGRREVSQTGKPVRLATEFDVPGSIDNIRFFAGAARHLEGKATGEYSADHTSSIRREAVGVSRHHRAVELSAADGGVEGDPGAGGGMFSGHQTGRDHPAHNSDAGSAGYRSGPADGVFNVVTGLGHDVGAALSGHKDVDVVTFTGSTRLAGG